MIVNKNVKEFFQSDDAKCVNIFKNYKHFIFLSNSTSMTIFLHIFCEYIISYILGNIGYTKLKEDPSMNVPPARGIR